MSRDLLNTISSLMPQFSKGQRAIAKYILENYDKAAFMTASKLGTKVGVSESTVVRFASELGYEGYPQLQRALQELIRNKLTAVQRIEITTDRIGADDVLNKVLNMDIDRIRHTLEEVSKEDFNAAVEAICNAKNIYIIGVRSSASLAVFISFYFNHIFEGVRSVNTTSASEMFEQLMRIGKDDILIGITFPRYSQRTVKAAKYARDNGAQVIAITDSRQSPIGEYADHLLIAKSDMASFVDSLVAPLSLIDALIVAVGLKKREEISQTFQKLERIWDEYNVYEKIEDMGQG